MDISADFSTEVDPANGIHDSAVQVFYVDYTTTVTPGVWQQVVTGLTVGQSYWARVSAYNAARG